MKALLYSIQSEWLKRRRSSATWLALFGGFFVPAIYLGARLYRHQHTRMANASEGVWKSIYHQNWEIMSFFLLPMGIAFAASLMAQIEYRNNTWKQVLTTPQRLGTLFVAKYLVVLAMLVLFFLLFNLGIYLDVMVPALVYSDVPFPKEPYPFWDFLRGNGKFFVACLPVLALQYLMSTHIRNFLVPITIGFGMVISCLIGINWKYAHTLPYIYAPLQFMTPDAAEPRANITAWALGYFTLFTVVNYFLFINQLHNYTGRLWHQFKFTKKTALTAGALVLACLFGVPALAHFFSNNSTPRTTLSLEQRVQQVENRVGLVKFDTEGRSRTTIEERMKQYKIKGLVVAVIHNHQLDWAKGYGWADEERRIPCTPETLFEPGSISKPVNALAVLKGYEQGRWDIFEDVNTYLQAWKMPYDTAITKGKKITLAQLLSHSAGLNLHGFGFTAPRSSDTLPTVPQILDGQWPATNPPVRPMFEPGDHHQYSGGGTMVSQLLQTDVAGLDYASYMRQTVLEPLGMTSSFFNQPAPTEYHPKMATGYTSTKGGAALEGRYPVLPQQAAAGLWTSATDLAKLVMAVQTAYKGEKNAFLQRTTAEMMLTAYNDELATLGFFLEEKNGHTYFQHGAGNPGFMGKIYGSMEGGNGVVILANYDGSAPLLDEIIAAVADVYQWPGFTPVPEPVRKAIIQPDTADIAGMLGAYQMGSNSVIMLQQQDSGLYFLSEEQTWPVFFEGKDHFFNIESSWMKTFERDSAGQVKALLLERNNDKPKRAEKLAVVQPDTALLRLAVGMYREENGDTTSVRVQDGQLWLRSENAVQPMRAHFIAPNRFYLDNGGVFQFNREKNGPVTGVSTGWGRTFLTKQ